MADDPRVRTRIDGVRAGHPVRIGLSGSRTVDYYLRAYLADIAAAGRVGSVDRLDDVDLLFEEDDGGGAGGLLLPLRVHMVTDLAADPGDLSGVLSGEQRRQHRRRVRQLGHRYEISTRDEDFDRFYDRMYLPTMTARHGTAARTTVREAARRDLFRHGHLMLVYADGHDEPVAGSVNHVAESQVDARLAGVLGGAPELLASGATKSAGHFLLAWALDHGHRRVDFQGCEPFLRKGTLQAKIDLGAGAEPAPPPLRDVRVRMSVRRDGPGVRELLRANPVVTVDAAGRLHATAFRDGDREPAPVRRPHRGLAGDTVLSLPLPS
ncbi:GNAT family N-acetyltransferase [Micromonospora sp. WMMD882]|uniref:GNAT family N-acetyltransferase n=1 Tax=Micromonospora sp. WMMD882 TaxID=3015151 RepID=UPI00248AC168|nr:GNAT family N-acetyltransferase [Micromonospora sp. WMMD882]WBB78058.1 GNAT family N-acetyltransferase [Micromonospora sp. WMMD882]